MNSADPAPELRQRLERLEQEVLLLRARVERLEPGRTAQAPAATVPIAASPPPLPKLVAVPSTPPPLPMLTVRKPTSPPPPPEPESTASPEPPRTFTPSPQTAELLARLQLLPPQSKGNAEARLGAWWATRIGVLLAVIGLVSFGIYISARIPPPVRFAEVALGAITLTIAGWRLERRMPEYGKVLFGGGLGAIYLVSLAGYAFAPMRVFFTPLSGTLAQFGAAGLIIALASLRRSEKLATLGIFFGFAAAWFAIYAGLGSAALSAGVGLLALAAVAWLAAGWRVPLLLATPLALLMPVLVADFVWRPCHIVPAFALILGYPALIFAGIVGLDFFRPAPPSHDSAAIERNWLLLATSSLALLVTWLLTRGYYPAHTKWVYTAFTLLTALPGFGWPLRGRDDGVAQTYRFKASMLLALAVAAWFSGATRWLVLAAQALVLAFGVKRSSWRPYAVASVIVWLGALACFWIDLSQSHLTSLLSLAGAMRLVFFAASVAWLTLLPRWLNPDAPAGSIWFLPAALVTLLGAAIAIMAGKNVPSPLAFMLIAALAGVTTRALRGSWGYLPGFALLIFAHGALWLNSVTFSNAIWAAVIAPTLALGFWLDHRTAHQSEKVPILKACLVAALLVSYYSLHRWGFALLPQGAYLSAAAMIAIALLVLATQAQLPRTAHLACVPLLLACWGELICLIEHRPGLGESDAYYGFALAALAAFVLVCGAWSRYRALLSETFRRFAVALHSAPVWLLAIHCMSQLVPRAAWPFAFAAAGVLWLAPSRRVEFRALNGYGMLLLLIAGFLAIDGSSATGPIGLAQGLSVAGLALGSVLLIHYWSVKLPEPLPMLLESAGGLVCLAVSNVAILRNFGTTTYAISGLWAAVAIALFLIGFTLRIASLRALALAGLGLTLVRVFIIDARSTFDRIIAFFSLSLVLLVVGFLYARFGQRAKSMEN